MSWTLVPPVGTITSDGVYTAPSTILSAQTVQIIAMSVSDSTQSAVFPVLLRPTVSVGVTPSQPALVASQTQQFTATAAGATDTSVTWSIAPSIGSISMTGLYSAPPVITSQQTVVVTARSNADPDGCASATVTLKPAVTVDVNPKTITLLNSQTQQFTATVSNTSNTAVTWSIDPSVGSINANGLYTAPSFISSSQIVTVTATSLADSSKVATAAITLQQTVAVSVGPSSASLQASQTQQFSATVTGSGNTNVSWTLNPNVGTISSSGLYTAPASISLAQSVTVTATSAADSTKSGTATVQLNPPAAPAPVVLPVEVSFPNSVVPVVVNLANAPATNTKLKLRIHGLKYETEASVQVNNSSWTALNSANVTLLGYANGYGGIGGGFSTLDMTLNLPPNTLVAGNNTVRFRFNGTDGRVSEYRVLSFNFLDGSGNPLVSPQSFVNDDPNTWQAPFNTATDIAAGKSLYYNAPLTVPTPTGNAPIKAACTTCHTQDGRDLKYFNYSNNSIRVRSMFHGLTAQQGDQIASYIRSLAAPNPGRPWNPPYQPGPGLDSQPVTNWAAGAGLDAVLASGSEMMNDVFPAGVQDSAFSPQGHIKTHEIRIPFQLMDWNQWLPGTAPLDAFGAAFTNSDYNKHYQTLRANLKVGDATAYASQKDELNYFIQGFATLRAQVAPTSTDWTADQRANMYSLPLWGLVKTWECYQEFQLEGLAQSIFGPQSDTRAWYSSFAFTVSPFFQQIPAGPGVGNGLLVTHDYHSFAWYQLQLILNNSEKKPNGIWPIDWGYSYGMLNTLNRMNPGQAALLFEWLINGLQIQNNGGGPDNGGWASDRANLNVGILQTPEVQVIWNGIPQATHAAMNEGFLKAWLSQVTAFTPQQFYTNGAAAANQVPQHGLGAVWAGRWVDTVWYSIPQFHATGVSQTTINAVADWAKKIWPLGNWDATKTATCGPNPNDPTMLVCSTEY